MTKISIITINYNNLKGLKKTMASVINQTYKDFEYIVVDGGSTDGSVAFLEENNTSIEWISEPDNGVYHAMNKGVKKASGEYLLFLNSGDHFLDNNSLNESHVHIANYDFIYFKIKVVESSKAYIKTYPKTLSFAYFIKDTLPHPATFIKRALFNTMGGYKDDFKITSDWKFFMDAICKFNVSYKYINKTLSVFYLGGMSSLPESRTIIFNEKQQVLQTEYSAFIKDIDEVLENRNSIETLRTSRIIKCLVKFGVLNKF